MASSGESVEYKPRVTVLIPLRGGSKGIPRKNIKPLCGFPLCAWSISEFVEDDRGFDVWVSTDDGEIAVCAKEWGANIHHRSAEVSTDVSSTESVIQEFASTSAFTESDVVVLVQATSPLVKAKDVISAVNLIVKKQYDSVVNVARSHSFRWSMHPEHGGLKSNYDYTSRPRRQDWSGELIETGAFYAFRPDMFLKWGSRLGGEIGAIESSEASLYEIDTLLDWDIVHTICRKMRVVPRGVTRKMRDISLLVCDVDGTLTPGCVLQNEHTVSIQFDRRDEEGISLAYSNGIRILVVTSSKDLAYTTRFVGFPYVKFISNCSDKVSVVEKEISENSLSWSNVCCIGDDTNDVEVMHKSVISACPSDTISEEVRYICSMILTRPGGKGAVRELVDHLLRARL